MIKILLNGINGATWDEQNVLYVKAKSPNNSEMSWAENAEPLSQSYGKKGFSPFRMVLFHFSSLAKWGGASIIPLTLL